MQSALIQPHLMAMPNNFGKFSGEDVEKDSKCPRYLSDDTAHESHDRAYFTLLHKTVTFEL